MILEFGFAVSFLVFWVYKLATNKLESSYGKFRKIENRKVLQR